MGYDRKASKRPVNLTLNEDLVREARALTANLSETVEGLLAEFVEAETAKRADIERQIDQWIAASNAFIAEHGLFGEEHSTL
jgi:antitoxin CcdA